LIGAVVIACSAPAAAPQPPAPAAATTAPKPTAELPTAAAQQLIGDPVRGGRLYDMWWVVISPDEAEAHMAEGPSADQPLWKTQTTNTRTGTDTWRCKECHGWDYRGVEGAYGSGSHKTGFAGIFGSRSKSASEILAALKGSTNSDHDFSKAMDEQSLVDLALFVSQAQIMAEPGMPTRRLAVMRRRGKTQYEKVCVNCHGRRATRSLRQP
jgi:thiosulfate dehydrogenase